MNCLEKALEINQAAGLSGTTPCYYSNLGEMYFESGDLDGALNCAEKALDLVQKAPHGFFDGYVRAYSGSVLGRVDRGRFEEAEECVLQGMRILDNVKAKSFYAYGWLYLGELYADAGQKQKALSTLIKARGMFEQMGIMGYWLARTEKALEKLQG